MVMDKELSDYYGSMNPIKYDEVDSTVSKRYQNHLTGFDDQNFYNIDPFPSDVNPGVSAIPTAGVDSQEDSDLNDVVLKYIDQMLMEEDMEEKTCMFQESAALQAAEKSFYDILGEQQPSLFENDLVSDLDQIFDNPDGYYPSTTSGDCKTTTTTSTTADSSDGVMGPSLSWEHRKYESTPSRVTVDLTSQSSSQSSFSSSNSAGNVIDPPVDSALSDIKISDIFNDSESLLQFKRGVEEANKFLPQANYLCLESPINLDKGVVKKETEEVAVKVEDKYAHEYSLDSSRGKRNTHPDELETEEGRTNKQSAVYSETTVRSEMFDMVLLCNEGKSDSALREAMQVGVIKNMQQNSHPKGSNSGKTRGRRKGAKKDVVDLRTLLTLCAQAVAVDDRRNAHELLEQIRSHSSPTGDGMQRLAHYFANGLQARMDGSGSRNRVLNALPTSAAEILKAYHLFLAVCPFRKLTNFFANKTIMKVAEKATRLHIIDFGILYGFQWPCLIQKLSSRPGGPPKLRITGIDLPNSGFRPAERVEETGHRLANYAASFNVPFEFNAIAQKWETIQIEDLKLDSDEVLVVNCQCRFRNLLDETVVLDSPRDIVLNLIRKIHPDIYLHGVISGSYNAPFFISRFREAMFHYSSVFDMLETTVPREIQERMSIEKQIFGWEIMNVVSCEGSERIERPETYKQWQARNRRAGFRQLPLDREIVDIAKERVRSCYHKDFLIDEDGGWMLLGWKGRTFNALSSWKPAY